MWEKEEEGEEQCIWDGSSNETRHNGLLHGCVNTISSAMLSNFTRKERGSYLPSILRISMVRCHASPPLLLLPTGPNPRLPCSFLCADGERSLCIMSLSAVPTPAGNPPDLTPQSSALLYTLPSALRISSVRTFLAMETGSEADSDCVSLAARPARNPPILSRPPPAAQAILPTSLPVSRYEGPACDGRLTSSLFTNRRAAFGSYSAPLLIPLPAS